MVQRGQPRIAYRDSRGGWFGRRRLVVSVLAAGIGALFALPLPAASASTCEPSTCIPAGTPYAAEVRIVLHINDIAQVSYVGDVADQCSGASQSYQRTQSVAVRALVTFRQVTIPLLTKAQLGKAYRRLHVRPTATSAGPATRAGGNFRASGTGPYGFGDCAEKSFDTGVIDLHVHHYNGSFSQTGLAGFDDLFLDGTDEAAWFWQPPTYTDNNQSTLNVQEQANSVLEEVPIDDVAPGATWASFAGMTIGDHPEQFKALLDRATLTVKVNYDAPAGGADCDSLANDCRVDWTYSPRATLTRLNIYKTQKDYAK